MSKKLDEAILFATNVHSGDIRKISKEPYIVHPLEVAVTISAMTLDKDVVIAGLLHDVVEDAGITPDEVREKFGERVAELVASETEDKREDLPKHETWKIRKEESLSVLKNTDDKDVKILWLSDKLSNLRSLYRSYVKDGDEIFNAFNQKDKKQHEWYYRSVAEYVSELKDEVPYSDFTELIEKIFSIGD